MEKKYNPEDLKSAWTLIKDATNLTLLTHKNPDGDGISACAAAESILNKLNKNVETIYLNEAEFPPKRSPKKIFINSHDQKPDLLIVFDTANIERMYFPEEFKNIKLINIDHHISNRIKGSINIVFSQTSSTCEMFYEILQNWCPKQMDQYVAECLLAGILYDSQAFQTKSTYPSTLNNTAKLMELGADLFEIKNEILTYAGPEIIKIWGEILRNIKIYKNAASSSISQIELKELGGKLSSIIGFVNFLSQISGVDAVAFLCELETGETKVSLRSKTIDVNAIANKFGGGGHKNAAGATTSTSLQEVEKEISVIFEKV